MSPQNTKFIGEAGNGLRKGLPSIHGATAGTTYLYPHQRIDLAAITGVSDLTLTTSSVDGLLWLCESSNGTQKRQYILLLHRDFGGTEELQPIAFAQLNEYGDDLQEAVQVGRDWILTSMYYLSYTPDPIDIYAVLIHPDPVYHAYTNAPMKNITPTVAVAVATTQFAADKGSILLTERPFWERMNPTIGGYQFIHDFAIPRYDAGLEEYYTDENGWYGWGPFAVPYSVSEPRSIVRDENDGQFHDRPSAKLGMWRGLPDTKHKYGLFVVDGKLYIRTNNFIGEARITHSRLRVQPSATTTIVDKVARPTAFEILNMHNFGVWRKNYPDDMDWDSICIGKIGEMVVAFECDESQYDPLKIGPARISPTGRYIPLINEVSWADNPDGEDEELNAPLETFTLGESDAIAAYVSSAMGVNASWGLAVSDDALKVLRFESDGSESTDQDAASLPCYRGANDHFLPGGNAVAGTMADDVICADKNYTFVTNTKGTLFRVYVKSNLRGCSLETHRRTVEDDEEVLWEGSTAFAQTITESENVLEVTDFGRVVSPAPEVPTVEEQLESITIEPFTWTEIISSYGTDLFTDGLLGARFPISLRSETAETLAGGSTLVFNFAWINPDTGTFTPFSLNSPFQSDPTAKLVINYDDVNDVVEFGVLSLDGSTAGQFVQIEHPSYLDGWVGPTEMRRGVGQLGSSRLYPWTVIQQNRNDGSSNSTSSYITPPIDFLELIPVLPRYIVYDPEHNVGGNTIYINPNSTMNLDTPGFVFSFGEGQLTKRLVPSDGANITNAMAMDLMINQVGSYLQTVARSRTVIDSWLGIGENGMPQSYYSVGAVCMAHWCKDRFSLDPPYADQTRYKFRRQVNAIKCRRGMDDAAAWYAWQGVSNPTKTWSNHRFYMVACDVDEDKFKALSSAWQLDFDYDEGVN